MKQYDPAPVKCSRLTLDLMRSEYKRRADQLGLDCSVLMDGDVNSEIAIIVEAPGAREVETHTPLIGGSGQLLWNTLNKVTERANTTEAGKRRPLRVTRRTVYVSNVCKRQLSTVKGKQVLAAAEKQQWIQLLKWELAQLPNVKYILIMGNLALNALTGENGITLWRGSVLQRPIATLDTSTRDVTMFCAFNAAAVLRTPMHEPIFMLDMARFVSVVQGTFKPHKVDVSRINPSPAEAIQWCEKMIDERKPVAFDIEIMSHETACVGLANTAHDGMCINYRAFDENRWSIQDEAKVRKNIQRVFDNTNLIAQNGNFDCSWLWYKDAMRVPRVWFDTMLAHHTLYSILPHSLAFLTSQYTTHPYYKDEGKDWREGGNINQFWEYNIRDAAITYAVQMRLHEELRRDGMEEFFFDHVMRLQPHLVRMTVGGVRIDKTLKDKIAVELREKVNELRVTFQEQARIATNDDALDVNPNSPPQLSVLFYRELGLHSRYHDTGALTRSKWIDDPRTPEPTRKMLQTLNEYKKEDKFVSTYAEMAIDEDSRIRCEYKQTGVQSAPGRLSSAKVMWGTGANLQNQPERAYDMFITDPGYCFVYFDLAQAEARVVAWLANIETWIEQFERARLEGGYDAHRALASDMFNIPYDEVPTYDRTPDGELTIRYIAKRCRHGLNYRMAAPRLAETTGLPLYRAQESYTIYHRLTPQLREWWQDTEIEVRKNKILISPMGRQLRFLGRIDDSALDSIIAFRPQSTIGDKVSEIIYQCHDDTNWPHDARIAMNIHDALIGISPIKKAVKCLRIMKRYAESPIVINGRPLIIPADCKMSQPDEYGVHRWSTLKSVELR